MLTGFFLYTNMAAVSLFRAAMAAVTSCENDPLIGKKNRATFVHQSSSLDNYSLCRERNAIRPYSRLAGLVQSVVLDRKLFQAPR